MQQVVDSMYGSLIPLGRGEPIVLDKKNLVVGRHDTCDVVVRASTVSGRHCRLFVSEGYWRVRDLNSRNGTRVNNVKVDDHRLDPGAILSLANHRFEVKYSPIDLGAVGPPLEDDAPAFIFEYSLMEKAGLSGIGKRGTTDHAADTNV